MKKYIAAVLSAALVCLTVLPVLPCSAAAAEEAKPYVLDLTAQHAGEELLPYFVPVATDGYAEALAAHWVHDTATGTLTRVNDMNGADVTAQNANLFLKGRYYRYFEMSVKIKIDPQNSGLAGILFGTSNLAVRFRQSGNGLYLLPDKLVQIWGSTFSGAVSSAAPVSDALLEDGYYPLKIRVTAGRVEAFVKQTKVLDKTVPEEMLPAGRIGLFTAHTGASFRGPVTVYNLDENGNRIPQPDFVTTEGVAFSEGEIALTLGGEKRPLGVTVLPENATNKNVTYTFDAPDVAAVDGSGNLTALSEGTTTLYAVTQDGAFRAECRVTVTAVVTALSEVKLSAHEAGGSVGERISLTAYSLPDEAENEGFRWSSSDNAVAMVNNGTVTLIAPGTCTVTVKDAEGKFSDTCVITVKAAKTGCGGAFLIPAGGSGWGAAWVLAAALAVIFAARLNRRSRV